MSHSELIVVSAEPFNAETPVGALRPGPIATELFYVRSNFNVPPVDADSWRLSVSGGSRTVALSLEDLRAEHAHSVTVTMECAGNARLFMNPVPPGTAWRYGAVGTAVFCGVRLRDLLRRVEVPEGTVEVLFGGADSGECAPGRMINFERSLPLTEALGVADILVAYEMNGAPLSLEHGYPLRLVVPGYYGVASVKWLRRIELLAAPFEGYFQTERYVYRNDPDMPPEHPVTRMRVRALITSPVEGESVETGVVQVRGIAWTGCGFVTTVELSSDGGETWTATRVEAQSGEYEAVGWTAETVISPAATTLMARATDSAGNTQPLEPVSNALGYGNNAAQHVQLSHKTVT